MEYRAEIDGLRALAVLPVILFHAGFEYFSGGYVGVDIFFVISGYLITTVIISEMVEGKFNIVDFYEQRARRFLPALFFVMAACLPFAWLWMLPSDLLSFGESLVAVSTFVSNLYFSREGLYFAVAAPFKPLIHTWSLAVLGQYYILFPAFMFLTWRLGIKWITFLLTMFFLISLILAEWTAANFPGLNFYLLPTRGWEFLVGVFVAYFLKYRDYFKSIFVNQALSLLGLVMVVYSIINFDSATPFPSLYTLIPALGTALLILSTVQNTISYRLLTLKPIVGLGLISYGAYLWHQPLLAFARYRLVDEVSNFLLLTLCCLSLFMAWFSWRYVEKPFRNKEKIPKQKVVYYSISGLLFFILIGASIIYNDGFRERNSESDELVRQLEWPAQKRISSECVSKFGGDQYCVISDVTQPVTMMLIGDTHANHFFVGLDSLLKAEDENLLMLGAGGCPPLLDVDLGFHYRHGYSFGCFDRMNDLYKQTVNINNIERIYLSFDQYTLFDMKLSFFDIRNEIDFTIDRYSAMKDAFIRTISFYEQKDIEVIIIEDLPHSNMEDYIFCSFWNKNKNSCSENMKLDKNDQLYDLLLNELESEGIEILRTRSALSSFPYTNFLDNNITDSFIYRDNTHLSEAGSLYVIKFSKSK